MRFARLVFSLLLLTSTALAQFQFGTQRQRGSVTVAPGPLWTGILSSARAVDWKAINPGVIGGLPDAGWAQCVTTACNTVTSAGASATYTQINAAIASAPNDTYVLLASGTFTMNGGIVMAPKVVLRGVSPNATSLVFSSSVNDSNAGCGGQGGQVCFMDPSNIYYGSSVVQPGQSNAASWTSGFAQGATSITLASVGSAGIVNGQYIYLDQSNDTPSSTATSTTWPNGLLICDGGATAGSDWCSIEGGALGRTIGGVDYNLGQIVKVVSGCASTCTGAGPFTLTITPGLYGPKWSQTSPTTPTHGAWWASATGIYDAGVENLTIDSSAVGTNTESAVYFYNAFNCWESNVRSISPNRNHVWLWQSAHVTIQNVYFFGTQGAMSQSYGIEGLFATDNLIINSIFQQVTAPFIPASESMGNVMAYNFDINNTYGVAAWLQQSFAWGHAAGSLYNLAEGNLTSGFWADNFHGTTAANTAFRNYATGWGYNGTTPTTESSIAAQQYSYNRFYNYVGNVLGCNNTTSTWPGNCGAPYHTTYQNNWASGCPGAPACGDGSSAVIYDLNSGNSEDGTTQIDPYVTTSLFRWGNYDVVNAATQWNSAEVPTSLPTTPMNDTVFELTIPSSHTLPGSFYSASKPCFFGSTTWPGVGPDVSGGSVPGLAGHVYLNPAATFYFSTMSGPANGAGGVLAFNNPPTC